MIVKKQRHERNSNFELMRNISMLFIIIWHIYLYGNIKENPNLNSNIKIFLKFCLLF